MMKTRKKVTRICCLCHKIKSSEGWVEQERAAGAVFSHGYCPQCYAKVMRGVEKRLLCEH